jgi:UDP-N-acetylglucosamine 2-epimerase (non-hydrolysing)
MNAGRWAGRRGERKHEAVRMEKEPRDKPFRVVLGFGTRPEAIKLAPVYLELAATPGIEPFILVTGQHQEQLDQALAVFGIEAWANLRVMTDRQRLPELVMRILPEAARHLRELEADYVLVQGDTLSTFAIAWAAFLERIPVGHVEAGLRTGLIEEPFPEEANRRLTAVVADLHFAPTPLARANLMEEGIDQQRILVTGQTGVDALLHAVGKGRLPPGLPPGPYATVTLHRRENWPRLRHLAAIVRLAARAHPTRTFVFPMHRNPLIREEVVPELEGVPNVVLIDPLDYGEMAALLYRSDVILTDSGGLQEEGVTLGVPVVVLRQTTERPEGVESGALTLAGFDPARVVAAVSAALEKPAVSTTSLSANPYGDGRASTRVARGVAWRLGVGQRPRNWRRVAGLKVVAGSDPSMDKTVGQTTRPSR